MQIRSKLAMEVTYEYEMLSFSYNDTSITEIMISELFSEIYQLNQLSKEEILII